MSDLTMSFALPQALPAFIDQRVRSGENGNTSESLRELKLSRPLEDRLDIAAILGAEPPSPPT